MNLLCLDLATRCGFAHGPASGKPSFGAWRLKKPGGTADEACAELADRLCDLLDLFRYDTILVEDFMNPAAQQDANSVIIALTLRGCVAGVAHRYEVPLRAVPASTARVHFCGRASAHPRRKGPRTSKQKAQDRADTKRMVWRRCLDVGYIERGSQEDHDVADALALFDYGAHHIARVVRPLTLFAGA